MDKIISAYQQYILDNGSSPASVFSFCKKLKISESDFYEQFSSFDHLEAVILKSYFENTIAQIESDPTFKTYMVREKLLAFYYTLAENLKQNRSYILKITEKWNKPIYLKQNQIINEAETRFMSFIMDLIMEGQSTKEIEPRPLPFIMKKYGKIFWKETLFIIEFWLKDQSRMFEKTDTLIEKTVNTTMDLMARSPLDSLFDLGKFIYQQTKSEKA